MRTKLRDDPSGLHDTRVLGLMGDILPHQYPTTVEIPSTAFHLVAPAVRVPTVGAMTALLPTLDAEVSTPVLGPYVKADPRRKSCAHGTCNGVTRLIAINRVVLNNIYME